jgi:hypothetical protein
MSPATSRGGLLASGRLLAVLLLLLLLSAPRCAAFDWPADRSGCSLPAQIRALAPVPLGVVWVERAGVDPAADFAALRAQGFTALKQLLPRAPAVGALSPAAAAARLAELFNLALDAEIIPWWYGEGGWGCITQALLRNLSLPLDAAPAALLASPAMRAHQAGVLEALCVMVADQEEERYDYDWWFRSREQAELATSYHALSRLSLSTSHYVTD